ncbi:MAG TPA: DRTGG domain-containing protein [bacterium]|jgi:predicted transcriptional regulator|nr:serine kinase [Dictyoglomota bacterium]HHV81101.1 serine kinase [bacterium]HOK28963.1 DRTGG domain-containing protein [bacterium]HOL54675.1 DRTGG domain-containing protein [bacterium]HON72425.1 DRTGG domain-containing protein [bacterium]
MTFRELLGNLPLENLGDDFDLDKSPRGGYVGDLLSNVMRFAKEGNVWITVQTHINVIAVATLVGISGIIFPCGVEPPEETIKKAREEHIALLTTKLDAFTLCGKIYELGIR